MPANPPRSALQTHRETSDSPSDADGAGASCSTHARTQTFHLDGEYMPKLVEALDGAMEQLRQIAGFGGLLCMEDRRSGDRHLVTVVTLWSAEGLAASAKQAEEARRLIAAASDLGVTTQEHNVVRVEVE